MKTRNHKTQPNRKRSKTTIAIYIMLRLAVIFAAVISVLVKNYENLFVCILALILFFIPSFAERKFNIELPSVLEILILLFIFAAEILGEMNGFYLKYPFWDTMLHTINGFVCSAIGFAVVDILNRSAKIKFSLSPACLALASFCFSMTIGVIWEFFEFSCDMLLLTDMQKDTVINTIASVTINPNPENKAVIIRGISEVVVNGETLPINGYLDIGLIDTMKDLIVNFIGALIFSFIGYSYVKHSGKWKFAKNFIPKLSSESEENE